MIPIKFKYMVFIKPNAPAAELNSNFKAAVSRKRLNYILLHLFVTTVRRKKGGEKE